MYGFLLHVTFDLCSSTVPEALTNLRILREDLKNMMDLLYHRLESQKQTFERMRIRMVSIFTVYRAQSEDSKHAQPIRMFSGAGTEAPGKAPQGRERPGVEVCEGAPHSSMNSLCCVSYTGHCNTPLCFCRSTLRN